jgi:hypothetical protein
MVTWQVLWQPRTYEAAKLVSRVAPGRFELPTSGLGNRCSIHLSYGATGFNTNNLQLRTEDISRSYKSSYKYGCDGLNSVACAAATGFQPIGYSTDGLPGADS